MDHRRGEGDAETAVEQHEHEVVVPVRSNVFCDPLVGIFQLPIHLEAIVDPLVRVAQYRLLGRPLTPQQPETFLGKMVDAGDKARSGEYADVEQALQNEHGPVAILDRRHEVATYITVQNVQAVDPEQKRYQQCGKPFGLSADVSSEDEHFTKRMKQSHIPVNRNLLHSIQSRTKQKI
jgi:hypothetical protein